MTIDWGFIRDREGFRISGYVPDPDNSNSGVSIATGVDLGQMGNAVFASLPPEIRSLLMPYMGLRKHDAIAALAAHPLIVTQAQADIIDGAVRAPVVRELSDKYAAAAYRPFEDIPDAAQTIICSVAWQYGAIWKACPTFWSCVTKQDWDATVYELEHFEDHYTSRRMKEACYLRAALHIE